MKTKFEEGVVDVELAALNGHPVSSQGPYGILLGDEHLHFHPVVIPQSTPTGRQILDAAGKEPAIEYVLYRYLTSGLMEEVRLDETVDLISQGIEKFLAFRTSVIYRFVLNGQSFEWGTPHISGCTLKKLAGVEAATQDVFEIRHGEEHIIEDRAFADLAKPGLEHFITRPINILIFVNTREKHVDKRKLNYWEVVRLAYPNAQPDPKVLYTVTYSKGPHQNPEGKLQDNHFVWIKERMVFNVTPTDKS